MGAHPGQARPGEWLRQQRVAAGLTQEDLAERSGVSVRAIADLERGRTKKSYPSSVRALARALGLPEAAGTELVTRYRAGDGGGAIGTSLVVTGGDGTALDGTALNGTGRDGLTPGAEADGDGGVTVPR